MHISPALHNALTQGDIKALVFDLDGVIADVSTGLDELVLERINDMLQEITGLSAEETKTLKAETYQKYGLSYVGLKESHGVCPMTFSQNLFSTLPLDRISPCAQLYAQIVEMKKRFSRVTVGTNSSMVHPQRVLTKLNLKNLFADEDILSVCQVDFVPKPNPVFFDAVVKHTGSSPQETLFIEDSPKNIPAMVDYGFWTAHITSVGRYTKVPAPTAHAHAPLVQDLLDLLLSVKKAAA